MTGAIALLLPGITVVLFVLILAAWALVSGILMVGAGFRLTVRHGRWWMVLGGVLSVIWGALLTFAPVAGAVVAHLVAGRLRPIVRWPAPRPRVPPERAPRHGRSTAQRNNGCNEPLG